MTNQYNSFDNYRILPAYSDVMSRSSCDVSTTFKNSHGELKYSSPLIPANMDTITGHNMVYYCVGRNYSVILNRYEDDFASLPRETIISVGSIHNDEERIDRVLAGEFNICVDIAHGHSQHMKDTIHYLRKTRKFTGLIIAGNVITQKAVIDLHSWGADIIKVGIGQGYVCETTTKTGVGSPQMEALLQCTDKGEFLGLLYGNPIYDKNISIPIIADGGIRKPADFCKALAIPNVVAVMAGSIFAGTDYAPGWNGYGSKMQYRGMASKSARKSVGLSNYIEGREVDIFGEDVGSTNEVFYSYELALQSAMSYVGARNLTEYKQKAKLIKIT